MEEAIVEMVLPGVYIEVHSEGLISVGGIVTGRIGIVGTASKGPASEVVSLSRYSQAKEVFGNYDTWNPDRNSLTLIRALEQAFNNGASDVRAIRVGGAGMTRASVTLKDISDNDQVIIQASDPGDWANNGIVKIETNVERKIKRFTISNDGPFNDDLTELQLVHSDLVTTEGDETNLSISDMQIRNVSQSPPVSYLLGNSLPTSETFSVDRAIGTITFGAAQNVSDVLEVTYYIIRRTVVFNERHNIDSSNEIILNRVPVDYSSMRVVIGSHTFKPGDAPGTGVFTITDQTLGFDNNDVSEGDLVTVTYRYAPLSRITLSLPTNQEEVYVAVNAQDLANQLDEKDAAGNTFFTYQPAGTLTNPLSNVEASITGGNNGAGAGTAQYKQGMVLLENEDVNIVLAAGLGAGQFTSELLSHVESMESQGSDRIGLIGSELNDDLDRIKEHTEVLGHRRMIMVAPGIKTIDATATQEQGRSVEVTLPGSYAAAAVAGKLASLAVHISPTNKTLAVRGLEHEFFRADKKDLVQNRVLCLEKKEGFRMIRGISTDSGAFKQITTRRIVDKAKAGIRIGSLPFIGKLNNERVRKALKGTLDGFLTTMVQDEALIGYDLEVTATREDEIAGRAMVTVGLRPTFSIDYIKVIMNLN